jgi:hypothetical protein
MISILGQVKRQGLGEFRGHREKQDFPAIGQNLLEQNTPCRGKLWSEVAKFVRLKGSGGAELWWSILLARMGHTSVLV